MEETSGNLPMAPRTYETFWTETTPNEFGLYADVPVRTTKGVSEPLPGLLKKKLLALDELSSHMKMMYLEVPFRDDQGNKRYNVYMTRMPLLYFVRGFENLSFEEARKVETELNSDNIKRLSRMWIGISTPMLDQLDGYFMLKRTDSYVRLQEAFNKRGKRCNKYAQRYMDELVVQAEKKRRHHVKDKTYKVNLVEMALKIGREQDVRLNKIERLKEIFEGYNEILLEDMEYLNSWHFKKKQNYVGTRTKYICHYTLNIDNCLPRNTKSISHELGQY
jgi:hypothetical protein